jgi:thiol-disulfide isomerase/thioredoxin
MRRTAGALIAAMTPGFAVLVGAVAVAVVVGIAWQLTNGRMRSPRASREGRARTGASVPLSPRVLQDAGLRGTGLRRAGLQADGVAASPGLAGQAHALEADAVEADAVVEPQVAQEGILTTGQLGQALGERATLVQFSSAFCAPCRATRRILADVAGMTEGVTHIEIDAESRLDLVRQLNVLRTPTVLVLAGDGRIVRRASGQPRKPDVIAAIGVAAAP